MLDLIHTQMKQVDAAESNLTALEGLLTELKTSYTTAQKQSPQIIDDISRRAGHTASRMNLLVQILAFLDIVLNALGVSMAADQITLNNVVNLPSTCNQTWYDEEANLYRAQQEAEEDYEACVNGWLDAVHWMNNNCTALTTWLSGLTEPVCQLPTTYSTASSVRQQTIDDWDDFTQDGDLWFTTHTPLYQAKDQACTDATDLVANKIAECLGFQILYEDKRCQWVQHRFVMCDHILLCYNTGISAFNIDLSSVVAKANLRVREAAAIFHVKCLVQYMMMGLYNIALCPMPALDGTCTQPNPYLSTPMPEPVCYNNTFPTAPNANTCPGASLEAYPGSNTVPDWYTHAYGFHDPLTPAKSPYAVGPCNFTAIDPNR